MSDLQSVNPSLLPEDHGHRLTRTTQPFVTPVMIGANVLIFLGMLVYGLPFLSPAAQEILPWGANFGPLTTSGQWWRLLSACFLHFGIIHIAMNMYILFQIGLFTEMLFGSARFLLLYLLAGVGGNIAGLYLHPLTVGAGASGAIFGIYGGLLGFLLIRRGVVPRAGALGIAKSAGIFLVYNLVYGLASPSTDLVAHVAGLLTGFAAGCLYAWSLAAAGPWTRNARAVAVTLAWCLIAYVAFARVPKSNPAQSGWYVQTMTGPSVTVKNDGRLVYGGTATRAEASAVANALVQIGMFQKPHITALFKKESSGASLSLLFQGDESLPSSYKIKTSKMVDGKTVLIDAVQQREPLPWNDPALLSTMLAAGPALASAAGGQPLTIKLLNQKGEWRNEVSIVTTDVIVGTRDRVSYSGRATPADARALGSALVASGFFKDRGMKVYLAKSGDLPELSFVLNNGSWQDPRIVAAFEGISRKVAGSVGGLPIKLDLIDVNHTLQKQVVIR